MCRLHDVALVTLVIWLLFEDLGRSEQYVYVHITHMYVCMCT